MSDIVKRLNSYADWFVSCALGNIPDEAQMCMDAANEIERLRHVVSDGAAALVTGAFISPDASIEFMEGLPKEISLVVSGLRARAEKAEAERDEMQKDKARLDFLDECNQRLNARYGTTYRWELILNHNVNRLMLGSLKVDLNDAAANGTPSCRGAIDKEISRIAAYRKEATDAS